jgi:peptidoglycan/xylan/chitin deacetylase (PgdA/CDA1 family)
MNEPVAVLMYHSVAPVMDDWVFKYLSIDPSLFDDHVATLKRKGYVPVSLQDLYDYVSGRTRLPPKAMVITFDDGYLDNWVFAFPILRKYGFKGTVFIPTDFIDRRDITRLNLQDVWQGKCSYGDLHYRGFLSVPEMKRMLVSEAMDIQGHCKTHTWYFASDRIVDFHHPGDGYPWLAWNARPDRKPHYMEEDQDSFVNLGTPVYDHGESLVVRKYFPDPRVESELCGFVESMGGRSFFQEPGWREILFDKAASARREAGGSHETEAERVSRLRSEIWLPREEMSNLLDRPVDYLCWPGGAYDDTCLDIARDSGYSSWMLRSRDRHMRKNVPGEDPSWTRRMDVSPAWYRHGREICALDGDFLEHLIARYKGFFMAGLRLKWYQAEKLVGSYFKRTGRRQR